jgi:hypothetical protein
VEKFLFFSSNHAGEMCIILLRKENKGIQIHERLATPWERKAKITLTEVTLHDQTLPGAGHYQGQGTPNLGARDLNESS